MSVERRTENAEQDIDTGVLRSALCVSVRCVAGTYIRSLARDIGEALGCGGHLVALRRTQAGQFTLKDALTLAQLEQAANDNRAESLLLPMDRAVADWPEVRLDDEQTRKLLNGQRIALTPALTLTLSLREREFVRTYDSRNKFIAISQWDGKMLAPVKVFDATVPLV